MPHLQFTVTQSLSSDERAALVEWVTQAFAEVMETGTGHVAVSVRECERGALALGRGGSDEPVGLLDADVRAGRTSEQRATLASRVIEYFDQELGVPEDNCYVVFTEHPGSDFHLAEGPLASWSDDEAEEGATDR